MRFLSERRLKEENDVLRRQARRSQFGDLVGEFGAAFELVAEFEEELRKVEPLEVSAVLQRLLAAIEERREERAAAMRRGMCPGKRCRDWP